MLRSFCISRLLRPRPLSHFKGFHASNLLRFEISSYHLENHEYIDTLYSKLSLRDDYKFLDTNLQNQESVIEDKNLATSTEFKEFLKILASAEGEVNKEKLKEIQNLFSEKFQAWTKVSQLRVSFLMYIDKRIDSSDYLNKVIKHIVTSYDLQSLEGRSLTALMLLIYFKRDLSVDDLSEFLDLEDLQVAISVQLANNKLTQEELCAICLGLKKISNFKINNKYLRLALYNELKHFKSIQDPMNDFFVITLMTTLSKGNLVFLDDVEMVADMLENMERLIKHKYLNLSTSVKLLTYPLTLGFSNKSIEETVFSDIGEKLKLLDTWDIVQLCSYMSKQMSDEAVTVPATEVLNHLDDRLDTIADVDQLIDIIECYHYLSHLRLFSDRFNELVFSEYNSLPKELFRQKGDMKVIADKVLTALLSKMNVEKHREKEIERNNKKTISVLTRVPAFISSCYRLEAESLNQDAVMDRDKAHVLSMSQHRQLPMELLVPQMKTKNLDTRWRHLISCHKALVRFFGTEEYVGVTRILPHFSEPDLVFGNIGGICLSIPGYLTDPDYQGARPCPPGDWWVLVVGTKKSHDLEGRVVGQEKVKIRQLQKLGYTPIVMPFNHQTNFQVVAKTIAKMLKAENVSIPNLDDGYRERNRKF